jgi:single stranded DNA-binding protein
MGNLGKDLDLRKTPKGADVASGTLAVKTTTESGDSTTWWKLTFWGDAALSASAAVSKGTQVMVKGPASINTYTTASGENRETLELTVKEMTIIQKTKKE